MIKITARDTVYLYKCKMCGEYHADSYRSEPAVYILSIHTRYLADYHDRIHLQYDTLHDIKEEK